MNDLYYMNKAICYQFFSAVHDKFGPVSKRTHSRMYFQLENVV